MLFFISALTKADMKDNIEETRKELKEAQQENTHPNKYFKYLLRQDHEEKDYRMNMIGKTDAQSINDEE